MHARTHKHRSIYVCIYTPNVRLAVLVLETKHQPHQQREARNVREEDAVLDELEKAVHGGVGGAVRSAREHNHLHQLWGVFVWRFEVLFLSCVCVGGVVLAMCVCVCALLIFELGPNESGTGAGVHEVHEQIRVDRYIYRCRYTFRDR